METKKRSMTDVCFINGCDASVPHPPRYRVTHQREQLEHHGITTSEIYYAQLNPEWDVKYANVFVIFRCPIIPQVEKLIELAKEQNKKVFFDIDDLVVDTVYTDTLPYVQGLDALDRTLYDDGVIRMGKTLRLCDGAVTTTKTLAEELSKYVPFAMINRNTASLEMQEDAKVALPLKKENLTEDVLLDEKGTKVPARQEGELRIGYFSGSITHNADVEMIMPALVKLLSEHPALRFYVVGELDLPEELQPYKNQIVSFPFMDWHVLPKLIALVDINLAPLCDTIFNRAKSENKWVEASLVDTVSVTSRVGAFEEMIEDGETGFLCKDNDEWYAVLSELLSDEKKREEVVKKAHAFCEAHCVTQNSGDSLVELIKKQQEKTVLLMLPSSEISGGIMVALQHALFLNEAGYAVTILADYPTVSYLEYNEHKFPIIAYDHEEVHAAFQKEIATMWVTLDYMKEWRYAKERYYLVQNYETDFYPEGNPLRPQAEETYHRGSEINYVTISKWCQEWLLEKYNQHASYAPNGIKLENFRRHRRAFDPEKKIRILIEGDSAVEYKGVDDSFHVVEKLDPEKFEVWYMSYNGLAKPWYRVDRFLCRIPYEEVGKVYGLCDILIKSSTLESFSYPPLEMMATGGYVVAVQNGGNKEFMKDGYNCLIYPSKDADAGAKAVGKIVSDGALREKLYQSYGDTVDAREWQNIKGEILSLYGVEIAD